MNEENKRLAQSLSSSRMGYIRREGINEQQIEEEFMENIKNEVLPYIKQSVKNFEDNNFPCTFRFQWQMSCSHPSTVMEMVDEVRRSDKSDAEKKDKRN